MKMIVKVAVLFATLLLLTGIAFAQYNDCDCYLITCTNLDIDMVVADHPVVLCFDSENDKGTFNGLCNAKGELSLFFEGSFLNKQALAYSENNPYGYLRFHGRELNVVTGTGYCAGNRWTLWGHKADPENCPQGM